MEVGSVLCLQVSRQKPTVRRCRLKRGSRFVCPRCKFVTLSLARVPKVVGSMLFRSSFW